jgi:hypothetical protein
MPVQKRFPHAIPTRQFTLEVIAVFVILVIAFHFVSERIDHRLIPGGDEGSWMAVASQLVHGEGFTTRWLELPYLQQYNLPRPDDFRFPVLVALLAIAFKLFGISYAVGLNSILAIFLCNCLVLYLVLRRIYGYRTSIIVLILTVFSLLQLQWNSAVYVEGLFGLVLSMTVYLATCGDFTKRKSWIALGFVIGALYLVRPNGILLAVGLIWQYLRMRKSNPAKLRYPLYALSMMFAVMLPWLFRTAVHFGNPFHVAGAAGFMQATYNGPPSGSFLIFIRENGVLFPLRATMIGIKNIIQELHFFEHGLEIIPLLFALIALVKRKPFYNYGIAAGFTLTFILCAYAGYKSWAGLRYFSSFLPFVYAYGINVSVEYADKAFTKIAKKPMVISPWIITLLFLAPVFYPHRYYERIYSSPPADRSRISEHISALNGMLTGHEAYFAGNLGQLNFMTVYNCVGIQDGFDSTDVEKALVHFQPRILAITKAEACDQRIGAIMRQIERNGYMLHIVTETRLGIYYSLQHKK